MDKGRKTDLCRMVLGSLIGKGTPFLFVHKGLKTHYCMCNCICVRCPCTQDIQESAAELGEQGGCKRSDVESSDSVGCRPYCGTYRKAVSQMHQLGKSHPL